MGRVWSWGLGEWEGSPVRTKGTEAGPGLRSAGSVGLIPATIGDVAHRPRLLRQQAPVRLRAPGRWQLSRVKSKRRKSRHSAHTHQNWTCLVCLGRWGRLCAGPPEGVSWGGSLRNRLLPPCTALFVQWTWRLITGSQGRKGGARGSSGCHCLCLLLPRNHRQMWPQALQARTSGKGGAGPA